MTTINPALKIMGDPHLGRVFNEGVPLHRRGDREETVWKDFEDSLMDLDEFHSHHICLGDLFDRVDVGYTTVVRAAMIYKKASRKRTDVEFIIIGGNHDQTRTDGVTSSLKLFEMIVGHYDNITIVTAESGPVIMDKMLFAPWHPTKTSVEVLEPITSTMYDNSYEPISIAFGHWDVESYGQETPNLIPCEEIAFCGAKLAVTGHVHKPTTFTKEGVEVVVWGSLQPFTFAEGADEEVYVTLTLDELKSADPATLRNRCVRVQLRPGEELDEVPDCMQFRAVKLDATTPEEDARVDFDNFSADGLFRTVCREFDIDPVVEEELYEHFKAA